ncbi:MAG: hypothetical protein IT184_06610 [Acidobacteria bacterium]|nr:hypothetical protein [Acidobacteriota bacterium]
MARGWESKSVEDQIAALDRRREDRATAARSVSDDERERDAKRRLLSVSRARVLQDLQTVCNRHRRGQLERALADLDTAIGRLDEPTRGE